MSLRLLFPKKIKTSDSVPAKKCRESARLNFFDFIYGCFFRWYKLSFYLTIHSKKKMLYLGYGYLKTGLN